MSRKQLENEADGHNPEASVFIAPDIIFGKESTKVEISGQEPTCNLRWHKGVLQQLWEITERHMHYSGDHYNHSTYRKREKWQAVCGAKKTKETK